MLKTPLKITHHSLMDHALGTTDFRDNRVQVLLEKITTNGKNLKKPHLKNSKDLKGNWQVAQTQEKSKS